METPEIPANQRAPEEVPDTVETTAVPVNQKEPEEVTETVETPAISVNQSDQRRSQTHGDTAIEANQSVPD